MQDLEEVIFSVEELHTVAARDSAQLLSYHTVEQAVRQTDTAFEIGVRGPLSEQRSLIYSLSGQTHADGITHLTESYYPAQPPHNTWVYADTKPGRAPVQRSYQFEGSKHVAGWVQSRLDALFTELSQRYPDHWQSLDHER